ncbi:MAG TPA: proline dehydrogenase family protein [Bryobacteraceae bacterium]|nr:proline dehydrogenase family protein [Bryobacteraceae bacterium]
MADRITKRFVAGHTLEQELKVCQRLNAEHILATLDYLGENVQSLAEAEVSRATYLKALDQIAALGLSATVSIKPTQFGLDFSLEACQANIEMLVERAKTLGSRIEIDMESSGYVDRTLSIVRAMHAKHQSVRAVIQAYLYRSEKDILGLNSERIPVRLCKGAYNEPPAVAFPKKAQVDANYVRLMECLLAQGTDPAIASHDEKIIRQAIGFVRDRGISPQGFEFQMLYGIQRELQRELVGAGYRVRLYVPYGDAWYPYFMRRLAERPANVFFLVRNLFKA